MRAAPERAEAAFVAISDAGRDAMAQLRRMLGVLREGDTTGTAAPRAPQPGVAELPALAERVSSSGPSVSYTVTGAPCPLSPDTGATVYRIVQEALTNTVRHAGASTALVHLADGERELTVTVLDDGHGAEPSAATALPARVTA